MKHKNILPNCFFILSQILMITIFCSSNTSWSISLEANNLQLTQQERTAANKLKELLEKYTYKLGRELTTFHYQTANNSDSYRPTSLEDLRRSATYWGLGFHNVNLVTGDMMGPGHYVATDASGSRSFGGSTDPQLYVAVIKPDAVLLDARFVNGENFQEIQRLQDTWQCEANGNFTGASDIESYGSGKSLSKLFPNFRNSSIESCRKIIIQALIDLKVTAILYDYIASNELDNCRHSRGEALSIISPDAVDINQVAYFSDKMSFDPHHIGAFLKQLYIEGMRDYSILSSFSSDPKSQEMPKSLVSLNSDNSSYEKWKAQSIYKCGPILWNNEKSEGQFSDLVYKLKVYEISYLGYLLSNAYSIKFAGKSNSYFEAHQMRGFNDMSARMVGVSTEKWIEALKAYYNENGENKNWFNKINSIAKIFGENEIQITIDESNKNEMTENIMNAYHRLYEKPEVSYLSFSKMGLGPKVTTLIINQFLSMVKSIPFVTGEIPVTPGKNYSTLMEKNKEVYISYLQECLRQYTNEQITPEEINAGSCGIIPTE